MTRTTLFALVLAAALASLHSCDDHTPIDVPRSKQRTEGAIEGPYWIETERRPVGDAVYLKYESETEIRWFEIRNLKSRPMGRGERIPQ